MIIIKSNLFSRPLHGLRLSSSDPSDKSPGYSQSSAKRGLSGTDFLGKAPKDGGHAEGFTQKERLSVNTSYSPSVFPPDKAFGIVR